MKVLALMLVYHFIADFLLQSREMGKTKSTKFSMLLKHLLIQQGVMFLGLVFVIGLDAAANISIFNALIHGVIDWNIWRGYKWTVFYRLQRSFGNEYDMKKGANNWKYWEDHLFYSTIGLDQLLHGLTLILAAGLFL